ncbi:carbohydrate porin [Shewanella surugensis]|uniref:Carbohydrate porin n=1 Tax=Shewanella surugensis TaxID=212020 RepID=A0ABT0LCG3_9GAMM|nr:carbohydrate porin [Shewanella surugensis]MCL1125035.1 carbohydrate porin [Shewanella surugensis]
MKKKYRKYLITANFILFSTGSMAQETNALTTQEQLQQLKTQMALMQKNYQQQIETITQQLNALEKNVVLQSQQTKQDKKDNQQSSTHQENKLFTAHPDQQHTQVKSDQEDDENMTQEASQSSAYADQLTSVEHFIYGGYFRSGYGINKLSTVMTAFKNPDAPTKYRLGNEAETYGELILGYNSSILDQPIDPYWKAQVRLAYLYSPPSSAPYKRDVNHIYIAESFVSGANMFTSDPDASVWGGQRFYRLDESLINDFYFLDLSGVGAGAENIALGETAKLNVAFIGGPDIPADSTTDYLGSNNGNLSKSNLDVQIHNIQMGDTHSMIWLNASYARGGTELAYNSTNGNTYSYQTKAASGFGVGFFNFNDHFLGGKNTFAAMYGIGSSSNFKAGTDQLTLSGENVTPDIYDLNEAYSFRTLDFFTVPISPQWTLITLGIYQYDRNGNIDPTYGSTRHWYSFGMRPTYMFDDVFGLQFELGMDYVRSDQLRTSIREGALTKFTIDPFMQLGLNTQLRSYITFATWSKDYEADDIGGNAYEDDTSGFNAGVQITTSW